MDCVRLCATAGVRGLEKMDPAAFSAAPRRGV